MTLNPRPARTSAAYNGAGLAEAANLRFQLQFTNVHRRPWTLIPVGDLHWWTPVDTQRGRAADS